MNCPFCHFGHTKVLDSRGLKETISIRRRRECEKCKKRFTTYETVEMEMPIVAKSDGRREEYRRDKLTSGLMKACQKRPVSINQINSIIEEVEKGLLELAEKEVSSRMIGALIMQKLKPLDPVAYVRFASVYYKFHDVKDFVNAVNIEEYNLKVGSNQNYKGEQSELY